MVEANLGAIIHWNAGAVSMAFAPKAADGRCCKKVGSSPPLPELDTRDDPVGDKFGKRRSPQLDDTFGAFAWIGLSLFANSWGFPVNH